MPESVSEIGVRLSLDASNFNSGLKSAQANLSGFQAQAAKAGSAAAAGRAGAAGPAGGTAAATGSVKAGVEITPASLQAALANAGRGLAPIHVPITVSKAAITAMRESIIAGLGSIPVNITPTFAKSGPQSLTNIIGSVLSMQYGITQTQGRQVFKSTVERALGPMPKGMATGGHVMAGMPLIVGEKRPELFVPSVAGRIFPDIRNRDAMIAYLVAQEQQRAQQSKLGPANILIPRHGGGYARQGSIVRDRLVGGGDPWRGNIDFQLDYMQPALARRVEAQVRHLSARYPLATPSRVTFEKDLEQGTFARYLPGARPKSGMGPRSGGTIRFNADEFNRFMDPAGRFKPRSHIVIPTIEGATSHEFGHGVESALWDYLNQYHRDARQPGWELPGHRRSELYEMLGQHVGDLSDYMSTAVQTGKGAEMFAEGFAAVEHGRKLPVVGRELEAWLAQIRFKRPRGFAGGGLMRGAGFSPGLRKVAQEYNAAAGFPRMQEQMLHPLSPDFSRRTALAYEGMPADADQISRLAYRAFADETMAQHAFLRSKGFEFLPSLSDPYTPSGGRTKMQLAGDDVSHNKRLLAFASSLEHPLLTNEENLAFRHVHDMMGHLTEGFSIGPRGEYNAAVKHSQMYSPLAQMAMLAETHGQNSVVNFSPTILAGMSKSIAEINAAAPGTIYADQKARVLPDDILREFYQRTGTGRREGGPAGWGSMAPASEEELYKLVRGRKYNKPRWQEAVDVDYLNRWSSGHVYDKPLDPWMYHVTDRSNIESIMERGIVPKKGGPNTRGSINESERAASYWSMYPDPTWAWEEPVALATRLSSIRNPRSDDIGELLTRSKVSPEDLHFMAANRRLLPLLKRHGGGPCAMCGGGHVTAMHAMAGRRKAYVGKHPHYVGRPQFHDPSGGVLSAADYFALPESARQVLPLERAAYARQMESFGRMSPQEIREAQSWYSLVNLTHAAISQESGLPMALTVGSAATSSPRAKFPAEHLYTANLAPKVAALLKKYGPDPSQAQLKALAEESRQGFGILAGNALRSAEVLAGQRELTGRKITDYRGSILAADPMGMHGLRGGRSSIPDFYTNDIWMNRLLQGKWEPSELDAEWWAARTGGAKAAKEIAAFTGIVPFDLQAASWIQIRNELGKRDPRSADLTEQMFREAASITGRPEVLKRWGRQAGGDAAFEQRAFEMFGTTDDPKRAGWLGPSGKYLDFSHLGSGTYQRKAMDPHEEQVLWAPQGGRTIPHRAARHLLDPGMDMNQTYEAMMDRGYLRVADFRRGAFAGEMSSPLTMPQIRRLITDLKEHEVEEMLLDLNTKAPGATTMGTFRSILAYDRASAGQILQQASQFAQLGQYEQLPAKGKYWTRGSKPHLTFGAAGGQTGGGLYIVGEIGDELFVPDHMKHLVPSKVLDQIPGMSGGGAMRIGTRRNELFAPPTDGLIVPHRLMDQVKHLIPGAAGGRRIGLGPGVPEEPSPFAMPGASQWRAAAEPFIRALAESVGAPMAAEVHETVGPAFEDVVAEATQGAGGAAAPPGGMPPRRPTAGGPPEELPPGGYVRRILDQQQRQQQAQAALAAMVERAGPQQAPVTIGEAVVGGTGRGGPRVAAGPFAMRGQAGGPTAQEQQDLANTAQQAFRTQQQRATQQNAAEQAARAAAQQRAQATTQRAEPMGMAPARLEALQRERESLSLTAQLQAARTPQGVAAVLGAFGLGGRRGAIERIAEERRTGREMEVAARAVPTAKMERFHRLEEDLILARGDEETRIKGQMNALQQGDVPMQNWVKAHDAHDRAIAKGIPGLGAAARNFGAIIAATTAYGFALNIASEVVEKATPVVATVVDQFRGWQATSSNLTTSLSEQNRQAQGNIEVTMTQAAATAGLSLASKDVIDARLQETVQVKTGAEAMKELETTFKAAMGAGQVPEGLERGYGGLGNIFAPKTGGIEALTGLFGNLQRGVPAPGQVGGVDVGGLGFTIVSQSKREADLAAGVPRHAGRGRQAQRLVEAGLEAVNAAEDRAVEEYKRQGLKPLEGIEWVEVSDDVAEVFAKRMDKAGKTALANMARESNIVFTVNGEVPAGRRQIERAEAQTITGVGLPDLAVLMAEEARRIGIQEEVAGAQQRYQRQTAIPFGLAQQLLQQPLIGPGVGAPQVGVSGAARAAIGDVNADTRRMQATMQRQADRATEQMATFIGDNLGKPAQRSFSGLMSTADDLSTSIESLTKSMLQAQQAASEASYANQLRLANRGLGDAIGLLGKAGGTRLGYLQREEYLLSRASQRLGLQSQVLSLRGQEISIASTKLNLALQARQIATQLALAQFQAPGESGEERFARQREAILRARIEQRQLGFGRQQVGISEQQLALQGRQVGIAQKSFVVAGQIWGENARRAAVDARRAIDVMQTARDAEAKIIAFQRGIGAATGEMGQVLAKAGTFVSRAENRFGDNLQTAAQSALRYARQFDKAWEILQTAISNETSGDNSTGKTGRNGRTEGATGLLGMTAGATDLLVGEAGRETVAILRNPRMSQLGGGGGGSHVTININGASVRDDRDIENLARKVAHHVERALSHKGQMLGLRQPAY